MKNEYIKCHDEDMKNEYIKGHNEDMKNEYIKGHDEDIKGHDEDMKNKYIKGHDEDMKNEYIKGHDEDMKNEYIKCHDEDMKNEYIKGHDEDMKNKYIKGHDEDMKNKYIKSHDEDMKGNDINLNLDDYDKIFYSGNIEILNELLKEYSDKIYYINIEQMSHPSYYKMNRQIKGLKNIIDYSEENIPFYKNTYDKIYLFPPYFKFNNNIKKSIKCIDLLSIVNNSYREKEISKIKITQKQKIRLLKNCFNHVRDDYYSKSKIYINLHCSSEHNTMEMIRLVNLIMNKVIILTQPSICTNLIFLKKYLFICYNPDDFTCKIQDILNNYDLYYNKIYGDFNKAEYQNYLLECYQDFFDDL